MISAFLKKTFGKNLVKALQVYIRDTYGKDKEKEKMSNIIEIQQFRDCCIVDDKNVSPVSAIAKHEKYLAYVCMLEKRFPWGKSDRGVFSKASKVQVLFIWLDSYRNTKIEQSMDIRLEKFAIMFNLGALISLHAVQLSEQDEDGLKDACKLFRESGGIFQYLSQNASESIQFVQNMDIQKDSCRFLAVLMLAQAQACFAEMAIRKKMKPKLISALAMGTSEFFQECVSLIDITGALRCWLEKGQYNFRAHCQAQQGYYTAIAHFHESIRVTKLAEEGVCGQEIAWLKSANSILQSLGSNINKCQLIPTLATHCKSLLRKLSPRLKEAVKDNNDIYHELIPNVAALKSITGRQNVRITEYKPKVDAVADPFTNMVQNNIAKKADQLKAVDNCNQSSSVDQRQCQKGQVGGVWNDDVDMNQFMIPSPDNDDSDDINVADDGHGPLPLFEKLWVDGIMISGGVGCKVLDLPKYVKQFENLNKNAVLQYLDQELGAIGLQWTKQGKLLTLMEGLMKGNSRNYVIEYFRKSADNLQTFQHAKKSILRRKSKVVLKYVNGDCENQTKEESIPMDAEEDGFGTSLFGIDLNAQLFAAQQPENAQDIKWDDWSGFINNTHSGKTEQFAQNTQWDDWSGSNNNNKNMRTEDMMHKHEENKEFMANNMNEMQIHVQKENINSWKYKKMKKWRNKELLNWIKSMHLERKCADKILSDIKSSKIEGADIRLLKCAEEVAESFDITDNSELCKDLCAKIVNFKPETMETAETENNNPVPFKINIFAKQEYLMLDEMVDRNDTVQYVKTLYKIQSGVLSAVNDIHLYSKKKLLSSSKKLKEVGIVDGKHCISVKFGTDGAV